MDLNLLVALDALLDERSVTRAAARLALSQPATSAVLARLRERFGDQLLVRSRGEMFLTARASALRQPVKEALRAVARALEERDSFAPERFDGKFRLAMTDIASFTLAANFARMLRQRAPRATVEYVALDRSRLYEWLRNDTIDAAVIVFGGEEAIFDSERLFEDELVFAVGADHPLARRRRSVALERLCAYPLVEVTIAAPMMRPFFERMDSQGLKWTPAVSVPHFLIVPSLLRGTDFVGIMGKLAARRFAELGAAAMLRVEAPLPRVNYKLVWHRRRTHDPAHHWMRAVMRSIVAQASR